MIQAQGHTTNWTFVPRGTPESEKMRSEKVRYGYRFAFQGQEHDDELHGATGTSYAFEYRMHDPRVGRFLSIDPLAAKYAYNSPYAFSENRVNDGIELEGLEWQANHAPAQGPAAPGAQGPITSYTWVGYDPIGYSADGTTYQNKEDIPAWSVRTDIVTEYVPKPGTVAEGQVNYTLDDGTERARYYGVDKYNEPLVQYFDRAPWMKFARQYIGLTEGGNATIQGMIDQLNADFPRDDGLHPINSDAESWCGVFTYFCLRNKNVPVTSNGWQTPALNTFYGNNWNERTVLEKPAYGAIAVMTWGHVAMVVSYNAQYVWILGGNQRADGAASNDGSTVNIRRYPIGDVSRFVLPRGYVKPPLD